MAAECSALPMWCSYTLPTTTGRDRASRTFRLCASLIPRPMIVLFGLGTRLHVHMHTKLENGVLRNGQQLQCAVNGMTWVNFKFWRCYVSLDLRAEVHIVSVLKSRWVLEPFLSEYGWIKLWWWQKWHVCYCTLLCLAVFRMAFDHLYECCWSQRHSKRKPGHWNKLLACFRWSYKAFT